MSKMNNNSRKNSKSSKKTAKKATRSRLNSKKNFKIENLEPRLMMDASAGFDVDDVEKIEAYTSQFEAIAAAISSNASSAINSFNEFDVSKIGIVSEKIKTPINLFSKSIEKFEEPITNQVKDALNGALQYAQAKVAEQNKTNLSLSEFVDYAKEFVQKEGNEAYKDIDFAVDGEKESRLIVNVKLSNTTDVSGIEFNLGDIAKINAIGSRNLSSALEFQVAIDLDKNSDGNYLESPEDFSVEDVVVKKLNTVVKDFGGSAEFMGLTIQEQANSDETSDDLVLSFDGSAEKSKVTASADLEFALAGAESLPFSFADGQIMKVSITNGKFVAKVPTILMNESFLLSPKVSALIPEDSFVNDLTLKIDGKDVSVAEAASGFNELMGKSMIALKGAIKKEMIGTADETRTIYKLDATTLLDCLKIVAGETWFKDIAVSGENGKNLIDESIELAQGTNKVIVTFTQSAVSLNGVSVYSFDQNSLEAQLSLGVELTIDIDAEGNVSFTGADVCKFNLDAYGIEIPNDQGYPINGNKNELHISKEDDKLVGALKLGENLTMNSVFKGFSAADLPVFERLRIPVGKKEYTVADVASKMDVLWNFIPGAVNGNLTKNSLDISGFASSLNSALAVDYAGLETVFSSVEKNGSESTLNLTEGDNNLALKITLNSGILEKLDLDLFDLKDVKMDTCFIVNVVLSMKNGVVSFANVSLQRLDMAVNKQSVNAALFNGVDAELKDGKFNLEVSVVNEKNRLKVEKCTAELEYSEVTFKSGSSNLLHAGAGSFTYSYSNDEWNLPSGVLGVITHLEENSFTVVNEIEYAEKTPFIKEKDVTDIASEVDEFRNVISFALLGQIQDTDGSYNVNIEALKKAINDSVDSTLKNHFKSVKIEFVGSVVEAFDIFDEEGPNEYEFVGLLNGANSVKVSFEPSQIVLKDPDHPLLVYCAAFSDVTIDADVCVTFNVNVGDGDGNYICDYSLETFRFTVKDVKPTDDKSITIDQTNGLVVSYNQNKKNWSEDGLKFNAPTISFDNAEKALADQTISCASREALNKCNLKLDNEYDPLVNAIKFVEPVSDLWEKYVFKVLMSNVEWSAEGGLCVVDTGTLKSSLENILINNKIDASTWFTSIKIAKADSKSLGVESNGFDIWGGASDNSVKLTSDKYFVVFKFNKAKLNELNIHSQTLNNCDFETTVVIRVDLSKKNKELCCDPTLESMLFEIDSDAYNYIGGDTRAYWNGTTWTYDEPDFVLDDKISLKKELSDFAETKIPELNGYSFEIGSENYGFSDIAANAEDCWNCFLEVLLSKLAKTHTHYSTDVEKKEIVDAYKGILNTRSQESLFENEIFIKYDDVGKYYVTFKLKSSSVDNLVLGGLNLGKVAVDSCSLTLFVDTIVNQAVAKFYKAELKEFNLRLTQSLANTQTIDIVKNKYKAELKGSELEFLVNVKGPDMISGTTCHLSCTSYDLMKNGSVVHSFTKAESFAFVGGSWQQPENLKNYFAIADSEECSLKKKIKLADNYQLPYVGDKLSIDGKACSVSEIIDKVDEVRTNILLTIQNELNQNNSEIDLSKVYNQLGNASSFLSSLKLNNVELLNASLTGPQPIDSVLTLEFTPKIDNCTVTLGSTDVTTEIKAQIVMEVEINKQENSLKSKLKTFTFDLPGITSANTYESSFLVEENQNLKVSITENGSDANIQFDNYFEEFYLGMDNDFGFFDDLKIPLLEDLSFSVGGVPYKIKDVLNVVDNYNRVVQYITDESIELEDGKPGVINLATLNSMLNEIVNDKIPLGNIAIYKDSLPYLFDKFDKSDFIDLKKSNVKSVQLNEGENVLVFKISPDSLKYSKKINLGLVDVDNLSVGFDAYVKVAFYVYDGFIIGEDCYLDSLDLNLSVGVDKINLGLFDVGFTNGRLNFKVGINPNAAIDDLENLIPQKSIGLEYDEVSVGGFSFKKPDCLSYDIDSGEWTLPESIRKFASFTGDNLITKVHTVLNTTQSALRSLVESNTKLDFLDGSIEKVVDVVDKVEKVVYGDGSKNSGNDLYGLCKEVNGQYQANFSDVQGFVDKFNESWCYFVLEKNPLNYSGLNKICEVKYYYFDKQKNEEIDYKDGDKKEYDISSVQFTFNLGFELGHDFGLNFAKSLGNQLANISTCGSVHVGADASMIFTLKIDFESQKNLNNNSTLSDIGLFEHKDENNNDINVLTNDRYIVYDAGNARSFDDELKIKIVKSDDSQNIKSDEDKSELAKITINKGVDLGSSKENWESTTVIDTNADVKINYVSSSRQLYITSNQKFDVVNAASDKNLNSSSGGDAFAELKLTGSNLQTMFDSKISDKKWTLYITMMIE